MKFKLKICGMRDPENIKQVSELQPDYLGFIYYQKSPRFIGHHFQMPEIPSSIKKVGVFVDGKTDLIRNSIKEHSLDFVQLHGNESVETCVSLKQEHIGVIKAFSVDERFDFKVTEPYQPVADYFLFDTKGKFYGGNAKTFNWDILQNYNQKIPFFLSGGITAEDLSDTIKLKDMNLHAMDVNSGVELMPGIKDIEKIKRLQTSLLNTEFSVLNSCK